MPYILQQLVAQSGELCYNQGRRGADGVKRTFSQEWLKAIACITMLADHVGAVFYPQFLWLRIIGRISFPIFCFLLVEGSAHTQNPPKYAIRLLIGAVLSEFSFDYLFFGGITFRHQSVMVTLLIGFLMLRWMRRSNQILPVAVCFIAAELLGADYGSRGIALIWLFAMTRGGKHSFLTQGLVMALIFWQMSSTKLQIGFIQLPLQMLGLLALIPISLYSGRKLSRNKWLQWGFYLFYPLHLTILLAIVVLTR